MSNDKGKEGDHVHFVGKEGNHVYFVGKKRERKEKGGGSNTLRGRGGMEDHVHFVDEGCGDACVPTTFSSERMAYR